MRLFKHPLRESLVLLAPGYCTRELVDENIRALGLDRSVKPAGAVVNLKVEDYYPSGKRFGQAGRASHSVLL